MMRGFDSIESMHGEELLVKRKKGSKRLVIGAGIIGGLFFLVGILIGYFSHKGSSSHPPNPQPHRLDPTHYIIEHVNKSYLSDRLKEFTGKSRLAGTDGSAELAQTIQSLWSASGLDDVHIASYNVLLSFPNQSEPNKVEVVNKTSGKSLFTSLPDEPVLRPQDNRSSVPSFSAYSPAGQVLGDAVYVNYGRIEDFEYLSANLSMNLTGKIVIIRYGQIFRGNKVYNAEKFNASAVILYSDPADVNKAFDESQGQKPYPSSWWMPDAGLQRGTIYQDNGDPDTPMYPATDYAFHSDKNKYPLPKIPCHPISYGDALHILSNMSGPASPETWHGALPVSYKIGPGYENSTDLGVKVTVNNYRSTRPIHNVIGIIKGSEEPDRYVLLGNHHDAWVYGGVDPQSGGIALTNVVDLFGQLLRSGHRPRRTLVFCSWDAEEYGLIGSAEWVEDHIKVIQERVVAYLNVDMIGEGHFTLKIASSPLLQDALYSAAKQVPSPENAYKTLYDLWSSRSFLAEDKQNDEEPSVTYSLGAGSDHAFFYLLAGVSCADISVTFDQQKYPLSTYPLYHSRYDDSYLYEEYQDPGLAYTIAVTRFWAILAHNIAESPVLLMNVSRYSSAVSKFINDLLGKYRDIWEKNKVNIDALLSSVQNFTAATTQFDKDLTTEKDLDKKPNKLRMYNDKMMQLERAFISLQGLPDEPEHRHVVFAPSNFDSYTNTFFPGISDTMYNIEHGLDQWDHLKQQVYITTYFIQSAVRTLDDIGL